MAEEIIAATVIALLEKTIVVAADRFGLMSGFKGELKKMEGLVRDIQALLADAETKQSNNMEVLRWLKNVEGAALEAEYVLDELHYESLRRKVHKFKRGTAAKVCSFFFMSKHDISFRVRMSSRVRAISAKLKDIKHKALDIELVRLHHDLLLSCDSVVTVEAGNRQTDSLPEQFVAGRSREESEIVDMLLLGSSDGTNPPVSVLPIVGMGGLGKTTLAKSIYNNEKIMNHFTKRIWICVSDKFEVTSILKGILESLKEGGRVEMSSRDNIVRGIQKELSGERFLIVLDDTWNTDSILWDSFFTSLVGFNSANGSCCVLTTRLQITANLVSTFSFEPFVLGKLLDDDCWFIISRKATKGGEIPAEFEIHKEEILKKCQGLPLAANAIGGLLSSQCREDWGSIVDQILKIQEDVEGEIGPVLKLSYDYLPSRCIKKCFVYCSVYPKDAKLDGVKLIELWMAEGFIQDGVEGRTMEEVGADFLTILLRSSLLEKDCSWDRQYQFQMHDLVHDLACSISNQDQHDEDRYRNLAIGGKWIKDYWNENSPLIRVVEGDVSDEMLLKNRHVRVMHLFSGPINKLPNTIGKLKHIRCLTLSVGRIKSLPKSLCKLYNLQTLRLSDYGELQCLPQGLINLISLRHLHFSRGREFKMPPNMGQLTCLQTLEFFNVWEENGYEIKELGFMENLKGSLSIRNLELVKGKKDASLAKLNAKKYMIELKLDWLSHYDRVETTNSDDWEDEHVLEGLEPCLGLRKLRITNFMGVRFPKWLGKLSALEVLDLTTCINITELGYSVDSCFCKLKSLTISCCYELSSAPSSFPILEKFRVRKIQVSTVRDIISTTTNSLKVLSLSQVSGMNSLSNVTESSLSSCLKKLDILHCDNLTELPSLTLECCTCLESLYISGCPELRSCPLNLQHTPSLTQISFWGCPKLVAIDAMPRGFDHLTNLKELSIGPQPIEWDELKRGCSTTLQTLSMFGSCCTLLPQQLQHFSSLVNLDILEFDSLERLSDWLGKLSSLQELKLFYCPKLEHLPTDAMSILRNLHVLDIQGCPLIKETHGDEIKALSNVQVDWADY